MSEKLVLAIPSKGRLQENTAAFLAKAGFTIQQERGSRDYRGTIRELPGVDVLFLSASEIVARLDKGEAHFGVTGEDLIRESIEDADAKVDIVSPLGFGFADVVVAVPKGWIDASTMDDLEEIAASFHARHGRRMRVATKYFNLTRRFFASHGVADYRIVESLGATEGAPAAGAAEFIVDITTTGSTLEANALKVLDDGVMLRSQANLIASLTAPWSAETLATAELLLRRIAAERAARETRRIEIAGPSDALAALGTALADHLVGESARGITLHAPRDSAAEIAQICLRKGAAEVSICEIDYLYPQACPLFEKLRQRLNL
jgi:ATP phosphoribosyltransferase